MSKLLLSLVLLIMIVAVSYIQAVRRQAKADESFQLGNKVSYKEVLKLQSKTDSLITRPGNLEQIYTDSLSTLVINLEEHTASRKVHRELLIYYKKRYESLPLELTEYERKEAISDLRQETAARYSISIDEFNRVRDTYKVTY